ncbi:hypothetical protein [Streptomyces sp. NPDC058657]|uniref:hypothetical protein n=1 Tax=unclassified Streptomyces TaxID=2593676 RepID=UPI0036520B2C
MRKAFTLSAIAVAATVAMAAPATAFASDSGTPPTAVSATPSAPSPAPATDTPSVPATDTPSALATDTPTADPTASDKAEAPAVTVTSSPKDRTGYAAGERVTFTVTAPSAAKVTATSDALGGIRLTSSAPAGGHTLYQGTGTVKSGFGIGTAHLKATADYGDTGAQGSAAFSVNTTTRPTPTPPAPAKASMTLSTDGGKPGDKVAVTITSGNLKGNATVKSGAFTGTVNLERDPQHEGTWHGRATVSAHTKSGYYGVEGYVGSTRIDTVKFGVDAGSAAPTNNKHHTATHTHNVKPLQPHQYRIPKGSVQTGMAPAAADSGADTGLIAVTALGASALIGTLALRRRSDG